MADEEIEYESDPEEGKLSLKLRRRVASDDEEEGEEGRGKPPRRIEESDGESEGAPAEYEDELGGAEEGYDLNEDYLEELEEEVVVVEYEGSGGGERRGDLEVERVEGGEEEVARGVAEGLMEERKGVDGVAGEIYVGNNNVADGQHEEERKEIEPFAVPTAGAFYMHDDRFRDNAGGRNRRTLGGRKLWESKDDRKWGHDKFEELTMQERHHEEYRRGSRGRYRGHGRNRGAARGYSQRNRPRDYTDDSGVRHNNNNNNSQNNASKGLRGRGPRRYQPFSKNDGPITQSKHSGKSVEKHPNANSGRINHPVSNTESDVVQPRKQVASNLNIASPPFYPTGSSTKDSTVAFKRDAQSGPFNQNGMRSMADASSNIVQSTGKNTVDSVGMDKLNINDSASAMAGKASNTMLMPLAVSASQPQLRGQGRAANTLGQMVYQPAVSSNQINRIPSPSQVQSVQMNSGQNRAQSSGQAYVQVPQFAQRLPSGSQVYSPPKASGAGTASKSEEMESTSVSSQMKTAVVDKGKGGVQGSGKGSFLYGGPQVMGASSGPGDQNFPTFLPVMQFGGQHPGGIGVPAVGMAFPGYVAQPQLGLGSSEMTWLPVLTGAAGALGATYCPPYIPVDGSYNNRPSGTAPSTSATSSNETTTAKVSNDWKPAHKPELASHDFGQKQKNPRRYTEMKFDHSST